MIRKKCGWCREPAKVSQWALTDYTDGHRVAEICAACYPKLSPVEILSVYKASTNDVRERHWESVEKKVFCGEVRYNAM